MIRYVKTFEDFITENPGGLNPPNKIYLKLENLIKSLLAEYNGGRAFFDALDEQIKNVTNKEMILELLSGFEKDYIASSGGFGDTVLHLYEKGAFKCKGLVTFNGKILTQGRGVESYKPGDFDVKDKDFVFVDDSYFSGKTAETINRYLISNNSKIKQVAVIYDGSKDRSGYVKSFYRYYK